MADLHIEDFYKDVAAIFVRLYSVFPRKIVLYVEDISGPDEPDEFGLHHPRFEACFSTMVWLAENDYLMFADTMRHEALDEVVLSQKAFVLLASRSNLQFAPTDLDDALPPSVVEQSQSNIAQLRSALKARSSIDLQRCVKSILTHT